MATTETTITVAGMTCGHCVKAVGDEIGNVPGVTGVDVDLATGRVVVTGTDVEASALAAAVDEAGYEVVE